MKFFQGLLIIGLIYTMSGCKTYKNIPYFSDVADSTRLQIANAPFKQLKIQVDDILSVSIQTLDPSFNSALNSSSPISSLGVNASAMSSPSASGISSSINNGYLVDKNGEIELSLLGKVKLEGLTTAEARDTIQKIAAIYYNSPTVNVRFANYKITILGEVARPGTYILPNEKATIFDALGLAGDLTIYGRRDNMLLIRDSSNHSSLIRFSLNSKSLVNQDFFYLKQNDVIYVEPEQTKVASLDAARTRNLTIAAAALSLLIVVATRIK